MIFVELINTVILFSLLQCIHGAPTWSILEELDNAKADGPFEVTKRFDLLGNTDIEDELDQIMNVKDAIGFPTLDPSLKQLQEGSQAMVSCDVPLCSTMGKDILLNGGNAADAGVTVALCVGSVNMQSSGIGGGGYIVSSLASLENVISIDAREIAPANAFKEMYKRSLLLSKFGGLAVGVPGELKGLYELYSRHGSGRLSWAELILPVIELNEQGFKCSEVLNNTINEDLGPLLKILPEMAENWDFIYKDNDKNLVNTGDVIKRPALAKTLSLIAQNGSSDIFYDPKGPIAKRLVDTINMLGGNMTNDDFANYKANVEPALELNFTVNNDTYKAFTSAGSSSGLALLAGINLYDKLHGSEDPVLGTHKLVESMKWMASARSNFGDFSLHEANKTFREEIINRYTSDDWAEGIIINNDYSDNQTFPWKHYHPNYELTEPHGTTHFSIIDAEGNSMGMTTTVNLLFGSKVYDNETGIILNNEMDDFSVPGRSNAFGLSPSTYNYVEPYKRPLSSCAPTIIMSSNNDTYEPDLVIGSAGGSRITTAVFQAIIRVFYNKIPLLRTLAYPRLHHQLIPEYIMIEDLTMFEQLQNITRPMLRMGHKFHNSGPLTAMNAVKRYVSDQAQTLHGVGDYWRKGSKADGY